jgi:hypothetical protein
MLGVFQEHARPLSMLRKFTQAAGCSVKFLF